MIEIESGDNIFIEFRDKGGEGLSKDQHDLIIKEMREVANKYGFDYASSGSEKSMLRSYTGRVMTNLKMMLIERINENDR